MKCTTNTIFYPPPPPPLSSLNSNRNRAQEMINYSSLVFSSLVSPRTSAAQRQPTGYRKLHMCHYPGLRRHCGTLRWHIRVVPVVDGGRRGGQRETGEINPGQLRDIFGWRQSREPVHPRHSWSEDNKVAGAYCAGGSCWALRASFNDNCCANLDVSTEEPELLSSSQFHRRVPQTPVRGEWFFIVGAFGSD